MLLASIPTFDDDDKDEENEDVILDSPEALAKYLNMGG